jgi:hypothetical protein
VGGRGTRSADCPVKVEVPRLSESIQRIYKKNNPNTDRSFQLEKQFIKVARAQRTTKDRRGRPHVTDGREVGRMRWRHGSRYYYTLLYIRYDDDDTNKPVKLYEL